MSSVRTGLVLRLVLGGDSEISVPATFCYDALTPFAVTAVFHTSEGDVSWVFGRDLLEDGVQEPAGQGDVSVWPSHVRGRAAVCISLASPTGSALLEADESDVLAFLAATLAVVPRGAEMDRQDLDAELADLLGDGTSWHH
jgi:hypothetical protein